MSAKSPTEIDREIGRLLREARTAAGWSQTMLGEAAGVTFQQIQKYENGTNRIAASRLMQLASVLRVPPGDLLPGAQASSEAAQAAAILDAVESPETRRRLVQVLAAAAAFAEAP